MLSAQVTTSSITGTVKDANGQPLVGATITAVHQPSGTKYASISSKDGVFNIPNTRVGGPYQVKIDFVGLKSAIIDGITLLLGEPYNINAQLNVNEQVMENVVVTGKSRKAATDKTGASTNVGVRQISTLPSISRSITDFTRLTPQANGNSFGGRDGRYNNIQVDGANLNNNFGLSTDPLPGGNSQPISLDAVEEVTVNVAPFDVRQANFTGAGINAITRSGDNTFKGSAYGYFRNQSYNGKKVGDVTLPTPANTSNKTYGARLGGPIIKNKLFFFISAEKEQRQFPGITFSPTGGSGTGTVSATSIDSLRKLSDYLSTKYGYNTGAYDNFPNFAIENRKLLGRLDWNISNNHKLTVKYSDLEGTEDNQLNGSSIPNGGISGGYIFTTNSTLSRLTNSRFSNNSMSFANSNYAFKNIVKSGTVELNSRFSKKISNQFLATYTQIRSTRTYNGGIFPTVDILNNSLTSNYLSFGMDPFTNNNDVKNNIWSLTENFTLYAGKHTVTAGASFEHQLVGNMFMPGSNSYYLFGSLSDFMNNAAPKYYSYTYSLVPGKKQVYSAELKLGQLGIYLQDEFNVNSRFKLTYGVRLDKPVYDDQPLSNPLIAALTFPGKDGKPTNYSTGAWPKSTFYISPRAGFRWDMNGDKSLIVRGGTGLFTGRIPFVFLTNIPTNSGMYQNSVVVFERNAVVDTMNNYLFNPNPDAYASNFPTAAGTAIPANIVFTNKNFKFPQIWRTNLALDKNLGNGFNLTLEAIYTKDVNAVWMRNANLTAANSNAVAVGAGGDTRIRYTGSNKLYNNISTAIVLENTNKGGGFIFSTQLSKAFSKGFYGSIAYTYSQVADVTANPGSQASSVWNANPTSKTQNDLELAYSQYSVPHRLVGTLSYRFEYLKHLGTTISFFYEGAAGGRVSYTYSGDMNGDGNSTTDLMYIPRSRSEIIISNSATSTTNNTIGGVSYTPDQQWDLLNQFIEASPYLRKHRGQIAERNGANQPFFHRLDAKLLQDVFTNIGNRRNTLQFSVDVLNFPNLINSQWGTRKQIVTSQPLVFVGYNTTGQPVFRLNSANNQPVVNPFQNNLSTLSTWGIQLGLRYIF